MFVLLGNYKKRLQTFHFIRRTEKKDEQIGVDVIEEDPSQLKGFGRIGIVTNQTCSSSKNNPTPNVIYTACSKEEGCEVTAVFGPQHGFYQTEQDNMKETPDLEITLERWDNVEESSKKVPLFSLYSATREPTPEQLALVDTLIVDLPDIGCRIYTYMITLAACLRAASEYKKKVVVLDRPNPLGLSYKDGERWKGVEGNLLDLKFKSFVGWFRIPMRHGLTLGELGHYFIQQENIPNVDYSVITVRGLTRRTDSLSLLGPNADCLLSLNFPFASPNMPSIASALFFPSYVVLEATNVSEGRGTTLPFQVVGAPYLDTVKCKKFLARKQRENRSSSHNSLNGITFTDHRFRPTFNKHQGQICKGIHFRFNILQEREREAKAEAEANLFALGVYFLFHCIKEHSEHFKWREPSEGYEYNFVDPPLLLIYGNEKWWNLLEKTRTKKESESEGEEEEKELEDCLAWADEEAQKFAEGAIGVHLYS